MDTSKRYDDFPLWIVLLSNLNSLLLYGLGFAIILRIGPVFALLYLAYILVLEIRLLKNHCVDCYYWGRNCGFGQGKLSSAFFKKGDVANFCSKGITFKDMIPDLLVSLVPILIGLVLVIIDFEVKILVEVILLVILTTAGNAYIRGTFACRYCKQRDLGCPAEKMFNKKQQI